jgi:Na+/H+ antiporter NhaC
VIIKDRIATAFVSNWTGYLADEIGIALSCSEVEALAALLTEMGCPELAATWIEFHAAGDDEGDAHHRERT